jgi:hypothetical protein
MQDIAELRNLVRTARLGPATYENSSQSGINTDFGMTWSWMSEAIEAWGSDDGFNWYQSLVAPILVLADYRTGKVYKKPSTASPIS